MTKMLSVGDRVKWRSRRDAYAGSWAAIARVVRIAWGTLPCTAAPWWAARHLWVTLDDGRIVPGRFLVPA